ncbi:MAG: nodulation protein NfeD [Bacillaceae bacterium]|nr:nodulation protein NfeD [Bacillaceae bacterium]
MYKRIRQFIFLTFVLFAVVSGFHQPVHSQPSSDIVYFIPVEQAVERGLEAFLRRAVTTAEAEEASHIVFEVNTPGGLVDAATNIALIITNTEIPTTAFVTSEALSAGAYISLNADHIVMAPGTRMGSAAVIDGAGNAAEEKMQSSWLATLESAAELRDRDPIYARAMADKNIDLPQYRAGKGELLTLTASEALEVGYADAIVKNREEVLLFLGLESATIRELEVSFAEKVARFVTHPIIIPILLSIGSLGLVLELYSSGFGISGIMGISALLLFFFGHLVAGFAGFEVLILFVVGVTLIGIELFFPGFGVFGILGTLSIIGSLVLASYSTVHILLSILVAVVITVGVSILFFKYFGYRGPLKHIILRDVETVERGYVSHKERQDLIGKIGTVETVLRPSGSGLFDEERLDVVSEGGYIERGRKIKIVLTSGAKIVVREVKD